MGLSEGSTRYWRAHLGTWNEANWLIKQQQPAKYNILLNTITLFGYLLFKSSIVPTDYVGGGGSIGMGAPIHPYMHASFCPSRFPNIIHRIDHSIHSKLDILPVRSVIQNNMILAKFQFLVAKKFKKNKTAETGGFQPLCAKTFDSKHLKYLMDESSRIIWFSHDVPKLQTSSGQKWLRMADIGGLESLCEKWISLSDHYLKTDYSTHFQLGVYTNRITFPKLFNFEL